MNADKIEELRSANGVLSEQLGVLVTQNKKLSDDNDRLAKMRIDIWKQLESTVDENNTLRENTKNCLAVAAKDIKELRTALALAHYIADSWIHDQLDGTGMLDEALEELRPATEVLERSK